MKKTNPILIAAIIIASFITSCGRNSTENNAISALRDSISRIIETEPGRFGVAVIFDNGDTLSVNNSADYPMMSMFKLPQALAVSNTLDSTGQNLDRTVTLERSSLDPDTYSPMLQDYIGDSWKISIGTLISYAVVMSDNNASNILFDSITSVSETNRFIRNIIPGEDMELRYREADMQADHSLIYENRSSPMAYARLVKKIFTDTIVDPNKQKFIREAMSSCSTGQNRITAGVKTIEGATLAHKTGTGFTDANGHLTAIGDGGLISFPDGSTITLVIMGRDYAGPQEKDEETMARITSTILRNLPSKSK